MNFHAAGRTIPGAPFIDISIGIDFTVPIANVSGLYLFEKRLRRFV
jgi:hypothetical protein